MPTQAKQKNPFQVKKPTKGFSTAFLLEQPTNAITSPPTPFPIMQKKSTQGWQKTQAFAQLSVPAQPKVQSEAVASILKLASQQPATAIPLPPPPNAQNNLRFINQLNSTFRPINGKNLPATKQKGLLIMLIGLMLSGGLMIGATNTPVSEEAPAARQSINKKNTAKAPKNNRLLTELTASAEPLPTDVFDAVDPATAQHTQANQSIAFTTVATTSLATPPTSAVDDTLTFETETTPTRQQAQPKQTLKKSATATHVVDLFEDTAPIPSLSLPEQKKRETLEEALNAPATPPAYQPADTNNHSWWRPAMKSVFDFRRPLSHLKVSSHFGHRWGRLHRGVDFMAPYGVGIYAANAGTVVYSGWEQGYGKLVVIDHGNGVRTKYAHCSKLHVSVGEWVAKGERIAKVGSTGHSTGPHLHFEVVVNGQTKNPLAYLTT